MIAIYNKICTERNRLDKKIREIQTQLSNLPEGSIACVRDGKYIKWYVSRDGKQTYLSKKNHNLAKQLAVKKYLTYLFEETRREKEALEQYIQYHDKKVS